MPEYAFSLKRILLYKDAIVYEIVDSVLTRENTDQRKALLG